jgi:hypothetical protein
MTQARRRRWPWILLVLIVAGVALRLALPSIVEREVNRRLDRMGDYHGQLVDVDLHLWRGAYTIEGLRIVRRNAKAPPLLDAPRLDLSVSWRALLDGGIVASADFERPEINFIDGSLRDNGGGVDWREKLESLLPIRLDEVNVREGVVRFRNPTSKPRVNLEATQFNGTVTNLTNVRDEASKRPASLEATARLLGSAPVETRAAFDPFDAPRDFRLDLKVTGIDLTRANDFLQAYAKLDAESGSGDFVLQLDASEGRLTGYAKPLLQHVRIFNWKQDIEEQGDNPLRAAWEALAGGIENLFKNPEADQFATRIEISGRIGDAKTGTWKAIVAVLSNAFGEAFRPQFDKLPTRGPEDDE